MPLTFGLLLGKALLLAQAEAQDRDVSEGAASWLMWILFIVFPDQAGGRKEAPWLPGALSRECKPANPSQILLAASCVLAWWPFPWACEGKETGGVCSFAFVAWRDGVGRAAGSTLLRGWEKQPGCWGSSVLPACASLSPPAFLPL